MSESYTYPKTVPLADEPQSAFRKHLEKNHESGPSGSREFLAEFPFWTVRASFPSPPRNPLGTPYASYSSLRLQAPSFF